MPLRKRRNSRRRRKSSLDAEGYSEAAKDRLRSIADSSGYDFDPDERDEVEARIRNMWYGAKKEGSRAEEDDAEGEDDSSGS